MPGSDNCADTGFRSQDSEENVSVGVSPELRNIDAALFSMFMVHYLIREGHLLKTWVPETPNK